jgi:hypothetical protein
MRSGECLALPPIVPYNDSVYLYSDRCTKAMSIVANQINEFKAKVITHDSEYENNKWTGWYMPGCGSTWPNIRTELDKVGQTINFIVPYYYNKENWPMVEKNKTRVVRESYLHRQKWLQQLTSRVRIPTHDITALELVKECVWQDSDSQELKSVISKYPRPELWIDRTRPWQVQAFQTPVNLRTTTTLLSNTSTVHKASK